jgi:hypothetical protein
MSQTFSTSSPFTLEEFTATGGEDIDLTFMVYTSGSVPVNLNGSTITWKIAPQGTTTSVLTKTGTSGSTTGEFSVAITAAESILLAGRYEQQYNVLDSNNKNFRASGLCLIHAGLV